MKTLSVGLFLFCSLCLLVTYLTERLPLEMPRELPLGNVAEGAVCRKVVSITNSTRVDYRCIGVEEACHFGCFGSNDDLPMLIPAGETVQLSLRYRAPQLSTLSARGLSDSEFEDVMHLYFDCPGQSVVPVRFTGMVIEKTR